MSTSGPYLSANGIRCTTIDLQIPYYGAPVCDLALASPATLANPVTLTVGNLSLKMAVLRQRTYVGAATARLVGGSGSWQNRVTLSPYSNPKGVLLSTVLKDLVMATGSTDATREKLKLGAGLDRSLGLFYVPKTNAIAAEILSSLAGALWYVDAAGTTQIASTRTAPAITSQADLDGYIGGKGWITVATEDPAAWMPGATFSSATVPQTITISSARIHADDKGRMRLEVLTQ